MTDLFRYWTPEFAEYYVAALNDDAGFQKAARKFEDVIALMCLDTPDGKDVCQTLHIDRGRVRQDLEVEDSPGPMRRRPFDKKTTMARTTTPYAIWCRLDRGQMNVAQALVSPDYKVEGPKLKIARSLGVLNALSAVASKLPKTY